MNVIEAYENLAKLVEQGYGGLELIFTDTRTGDTGSAEVYSVAVAKDSDDTMGQLCDWEDGALYVPVYTDH